MKRLNDLSWDPCTLIVSAVNITEDPHVVFLQVEEILHIYICQVQLIPVD